MTRSALLGLVVVLGVALGLRLVLHPQMAAATDSFAPLVDSEAYLLQALRVADGAPMVDGVSFQAPLYPWLLGWTLRLSGVPGDADAERVDELAPGLLERALAVGRRLQLAFGVLMAGLVFLLGRALFSTAAGVAAGLLAATYAPTLAYEGHLLKVGLSTLPMLCALLTAAWAWRGDRAWRWLIVGSCLGLGGLVRGNLHLVAQLGALCLLIATWRGLGARPAALRAGAVLLGATLALVPMIVRNSVVAGEPVLSTAAGGTAFWLCNHAGNNTGLIQHVPGNRQVPRYELDDWRRLSEAETGREMSPGEVSRHWMNKALADIAADPLRWLHVELRKLGLLFSRYEAPDNVSVRMAEDAVPVLAKLPSRWSLVMPLALGGLLLAWCRRRALPNPRLFGALLVLGGAYAASLLLFIITSRFRMPLPILALLPAGYLLVELPGLLRGGANAPRWRVLAVIALSVAASFASEGPLGPLSERELGTHHIVRLHNRARVALRRGDELAARKDLEAALLEGHALGVGAPSVFADLGQLDRSAAQRARAAGDLARADALQRSAQQAAALALKANPQHLGGLELSILLALDAAEMAHARAALADYDALRAELGESSPGDEPAEFAALRAAPETP
ncbi:MAG: hypothetical protein DHS20C15_02740 [Planctomycetota bacterium]|nr:MAG: hypothetical protein DHS20C15_02740 [Planctomycetota bacterium]